MITREEIQLIAARHLDAEDLASLDWVAKSAVDALRKAREEMVELYESIAYLVGSDGSMSSDELRAEFKRYVAAVREEEP